MILEMAAKTIGSFRETRKWIFRSLTKGQTLVLVSIMYFLVIPLFSLIRLSDPLRLKKDKRADSYWEPNKQVDTTPEGMRKPY